MKIKTFTTTVLLFAFYLYASGQGTWIQRANFGGAPRLGAIAFSIDTLGYMGTGYTGYYNDFWQYSPATNTWTQMANLPASGRFGAVGFNIGNKGYISTGSQGVGPLLNDLWEYDVTLNTWAQKSSIPVGRYDAGVFVIGLKAYVFCGLNSTGHLKDVWEWNQTTDTWTAKNDFGGGYRFEPTGLTIGNYGYGGLGEDGSSAGYTNDFWQYDPSVDTWTQKQNFGGLPRTEATGFSINSLGYIGTGSNGPTYYQDFWEYNPTLNNWTPIANFGGSARAEARGFSIGNKGYVGTGFFPYQNDFWEYTPQSQNENINELQTKNNIDIFPNPFTSQTTTTFSEQQINTIIKITNVLGEEIKTINFTGRQLTIDRSEMKAGIYFIQTTDEKKNVTNNKIIIQ